MPVETPHPDYSKSIARWRKNRDAYKGEDAVKVKTTAENYLTRPGGFEDEHYERYIKRAKWYGATKQTIKGLKGAIFQKPSTLNASNSFEDDSLNITLSGIPLEQFSQIVLHDVLLLGRYGVLVDYNQEASRPFWAGFTAESIINWDSEVIDGEERLVFVVLKEIFKEPSDDMFAHDIKDRYRVCRLNENGIYQVDIYEDSGDSAGGKRVVVDSFIPENRGDPLNFIPFQFIGAESLLPAIDDGPLSDLVDMNFAYYRHSADFEHGLYLTGLPTPVVTGHSNTDDIIKIGSLTAWVLEEPEANAFLLEFQGAGLSTHERAMANDKIEMATLGARLLEETPDVQETLGAVQLRHSGETGSLKSIANLVSSGLSRVSQIHHWWAGQSDEVYNDQFSIQLNTDLSTTRLDPQELTALMLTWQQGGISQETLLYNLQQGEILPPGTDLEDEIRRIETQIPAGLALPEGG